MSGTLGSSRARKTTCLLPNSGAKAPERRRAERHPCRLVCWCNTISLTRDGASWPARVRDISSDGMALVLNGVLEPGTFLSVDVPGLPGNDRPPLRARVVRVAVDEGRTWILGCQISPVLSKDELNALL